MNYVEDFEIFLTEQAGCFVRSLKKINKSFNAILLPSQNLKDMLKIFINNNEDKHKIIKYIDSCNENSKREELCIIALEILFLPLSLVITCLSVILSFIFLILSVVLISISYTVLCIVDRDPNIYSHIPIPTMKEMQDFKSKTENV